MATYKGIQGYSVQKLSSDPTAEDAVGQLWYNSSAGKFKIATEGAGAWATGGALNTGRYQIQNAGSQTAALAQGGQNPPGNAPDFLKTELYDGTAWTEVNDSPQGRRNGAGAGTTSAAWVANGWNPGPALTSDSKEWDGTSWTDGGDPNTDKQGCRGTGTLTAGLKVGGNDPPPLTGNTETYDGTSWTETGNALNTARGGIGMVGTTTAALCVGGDQGTIVEEYDGSTWTEIADINSTHNQCGASCQGSITSALVFGGEPATAITELWNGTSWTEVGDLGTARDAIAGAGTATAALAFGGNPSPARTYTEEWADPVYTNKTVTVS